MVRRKTTKKTQREAASKRKLSTTEESPPTKRRKIKEEKVEETSSKEKTTVRQKSTNAAKSNKKTILLQRVKPKPISKIDVKIERDDQKPLTPKNHGKVKAEKKSSGYSAKESKFIGAHTSIAGHLSNAVTEAVEIGARAFGMFLKSQRQWKSKPLEDKVAEEFKAACKTHGYEPKYIVPHGSYLMNLASPNAESLAKSRAMLIDELQRCEKLGLVIFNFHPGSTCGEISVEEGIKKIADSINQAHKKTAHVTAVLENMCQQGNTIGGRFEELAGIIKHVTDKKRVGVCLDTCHAFAAGFDLSTEDGYENMMADFERIIGLKYLKAVHMNDSKGDVGCHLDRHENIGKGKIGIAGFERIMNDPRMDDIPFVLETPQGDYAKEIRVLYKLCNS